MSTKMRIILINACETECANKKAVIKDLIEHTSKDMHLYVAVYGDAEPMKKNVYGTSVDGKNTERLFSVIDGLPKSVMSSNEQINNDYLLEMKADNVFSAFAAALTNCGLCKDDCEVELIVFDECNVNHMLDYRAIVNTALESISDYINYPIKVVRYASPGIIDNDSLLLLMFNTAVVTLIADTDEKSAERLITTINRALSGYYVSITEELFTVSLQSQKNKKETIKYAAKKRISNGCYSYGYVATNLNDNSKCYMKMFAHNISDDYRNSCFTGMLMCWNRSIKDLLEKQYIREYNALSALSKVNGIPKLLAYGEQMNTFIIVEDLIENCLSLADAITARFCDRIQTKSNELWDYILPAFNGLCDVLKAIHNNGYVHGDLHAGNVLVEQKDDKLYFVKLVDFGGTRRVGEIIDPLTNNEKAGTSNDVCKLAEMVYDIFYSYYDSSVLTEMGSISYNASNLRELYLRTVGAVGVRRDIMSIDAWREGETDKQVNPVDGLIIANNDDNSDPKEDEQKPTKRTIYKDYCMNNNSVITKRRVIARRSVIESGRIFFITADTAKEYFVSSEIGDNENGGVS